MDFRLFRRRGLDEWTELSLWPTPKISVFDWGLTRSDITYDVVHVWDGSHSFGSRITLDRFMASMAQLRLDVGMESRSNTCSFGRNGQPLSGLAVMRMFPWLRRVERTNCAGNSGSAGLPRTTFYAWAVPFIWVIPPEVAKRGAHILHSAQDARRIPTNSVDPKVKELPLGGYDSCACFRRWIRGTIQPFCWIIMGFVTEGPGFNIFAVA